MGAKIKYNDSYNFKEEIKDTNIVKKKKKFFTTKKGKKIASATIGVLATAGLGYAFGKDITNASKGLNDFNKNYSPAYKAKKQKKAYSSIERRINRKPRGREFNNTVDVKYSRIS